MTRKTCSNNAYVGATLEAECNGIYGYDHNRLRSRNTVAHQRFTRHNSKFLHIDDLYRSDSTITKLFLTINDIALNTQLNSIRRSSLPPGTTKSPRMTRNKLLQRQTSMYDKLKSPVSPTNSDSYFHLRPRRHTSFVNTFIDSSGDDDSNSVKPMRELRSTNKVLLAALKPDETKGWESGRPKRHIKAKRFSIDESTPINNKNCLKGDTKKNQSRTTCINNKIKFAVQKDYLSDTEEEGDKGAAIRGNKIRDAELTRLNNEAENFLFPKVKDETSSSVDSESITNEEVKKPVVSNNKNDLVNGSNTTKINKSFKYIHEEESTDSTSSESSFRRKKRRLTQAEAFILDNQQYYKFEIPGSRLRYHGSYLSPVIDTSTASNTTPTTTTLPPTSLPFSKNNGDLVSKLKTEVPTKKVKKKYDLDKLQFSFEAVPKCEAWFETFQRQDTGQERYTSCCSNLSEEKKIQLPYELGSIAPLNPKLCYYAYQELRKSFLGESPSSRTYCSTPDSCSLDSTLKTEDISTCEETGSTADFHPDSTFAVRRGTRGRGEQTGSSSRTPRKSPRQHASTLAILSNFIQQRKRKPKLSLPAIQEENESKPDYKEITTFFSMCLQELEQFEVEADAVDCNIHCKPSAVQTLEEYLEVPARQTSVSKHLLDRKVVRKKRTNKTGWPNKSKRPAFKKEGSHSSSSIIDSTDNNNGNIHKPDSVKSEIEVKASIDENCVSDRNCVNVDLVKWEKAEKILTAKLQSEFQPVVRVQKLTNNYIQSQNRITQSVRPKISRPVTPPSPRKLRRSKNKLN